GRHRRPPAVHVQTHGRPRRVWPCLQAFFDRAVSIHPHFFRRPAAGSQETAMQLKDSQLFRQQAFIAGEWCDADGGKTLAVNNPATGETIGTVPRMGAAETRRAIEAADKALPAWRALTAKERSAKLRRWFELMMENQDRSEERRVGKECRCRGSAWEEKKIS